VRDQCHHLPFPAGKCLHAGRGDRIGRAGDELADQAAGDGRGQQRITTRSACSSSAGWVSLSRIIISRYLPSSAVSFVLLPTNLPTECHCTVWAICVRSAFCPLMPIRVGATETPLKRLAAWPVVRRLVLHQRLDVRHADAGIGTLCGFGIIHRSPASGTPPHQHCDHAPDRRGSVRRLRDGRMAVAGRAPVGTQVREVERDWIASARDAVTGRVPHAQRRSCGAGTVAGGRQNA